MADHHSEYLAKAVAALTPAGRTRVDVLLAQLVVAAGGNDSIVQFAKVCKAEADRDRTDITADAKPMLTDDELYSLLAGFKTIRDEEPLDNVSDWANAVLALLEDDAHDRGK